MAKCSRPARLDTEKADAVNDLYLGGRSEANSPMRHGAFGMQALLTFHK